MIKSMLMTESEIQERIDDIVTEILQNIIIYSKKFFRDEDIVALRQELEEAVTFLKDAHGGQKRKSGEPYIFHPLNVTLDVSRNHMVDRISIFSSLFHDVLEDTDITADILREKFGSEVVNIVDGLTKIKYRKIESFDKFFSLAIKYPRILYIKIFDRFHNLRTLSFLDEAKQKSIARETLDIYVKICARLSLVDIVDEMKLLCYKVLEPEKVSRFTEIVRHMKKQQRHTLDDIEGKIWELNKKHSLGIVAVEEYWSPFLRVLDYGKLQLSDVFRLNFIVKAKPDAYRLMGVINEHFFHVRGSIYDYISVPKYNNYRSLDFEIIHSNVKLPVSVTTEDFNTFNHKGILTFGFSENSAKNLEYMLHLEAYLKQEADFRNLEQIFAYHNPEEITVISKDGKPFYMELGSTALDFAFKVHSEIGLRAQLAIIDGNKVPIETRLQDGDLVIIETEDDYAITPEHFDKCTSLRAKRLISNFINKKERELALQFSRGYLENRLARYQIDSRSFRDAFENAYDERKRQKILLGILSDNSLTETLFLDLELTTQQKIDSIVELENKFLTRLGAWFSSTAKPSVMEVEYLKSSMCPVCVPTIRDPICGFFQDYNLIVHRVACDRLHKVPKEKVFSLRWNRNTRESMSVKLEIRTIDSYGITNKVTGAFKKTRTNIIELMGRTDQDFAIFNVKIESLPVQRISELLENLRSIPEVQEISL